jgi:2-polyprenyl-3-methyl-5-hydroxy-6-metoxy-1,4-benzoquinol methylase
MPDGGQNAAMTPDRHYVDPRLARLYDLDGSGRADTAFYLSLAGSDPRRILDLGCGTGILANAFAARGHVVTGVDPAPAMLDLARGKPQGPRVTWTAATAQSFDSPHRFDLIVMTGHAFQVLLDDADIAATLAVMRRHLAPGGIIAFETRNPALDWVARWHGQEATYTRDGQTIRQVYHVRHAGGDRITFDTQYAVPDATLTSRSTLRFATLDTTACLVRDEGLQVRSLFGDWTPAPLRPGNIR